MANKLTDLTVEFVSLVDKAAVRDPQNPTQPQRLLVWKADTGRAGDDPTTEPQGGTMTPEEMAEALAKAEKDRDEALEAEKTAKAERDAAVTKAETLEKAATPAKPEPTAIDKSELTPAVRAYVEKMEADQAARDARITKAEEATKRADDLAKAERDIRVTGEFITKAEGYRALVVKAEEFGPVLKEAAEKLSKEAYDAIENVLKAADEQIAKGELFKEHGRGGEARPSDSETQLTQKAEELRKADSSLTGYQAMQRAIKENPELAARHIEAAR